MTVVLFALICLEPSVTFVLLPLTCLHPNFFSRQGHCIGTIRDWGPVHATLCFEGKLQMVFRVAKFDKQEELGTQVCCKLNKEESLGRFSVKSFHPQIIKSEDKI